MGERKFTFGGSLELPVLVGFDLQHIMGKADINVDGDETTITIKSKGQDGLMLYEFLMGGEVVALSFIAQPVQQYNPTDPHKESM